jgi:hypothetical protein
MGILYLFLSLQQTHQWFFDSAIWGFGAGPQLFDCGSTPGFVFVDSPQRNWIVSESALFSPFGCFVNLFFFDSQFF